MRLNEFFGPTIQGEGGRTGKPSFFFRLNGCNLRCRWARTDQTGEKVLGYSICDSWYTSHKPEEGSQGTPLEMADRVSKELYYYSKVRDLVITGGEPLLQTNELIEFITILKSRFKDLYVTIETNGTIVPDDKLVELVDLWSVSPKLATSGCYEGSDIPQSRQIVHHNIRINYLALDKFTKRNHQLKFVYSNDKSEAEIKNIADQYPDANILLMPEGQTLDDINETSQRALEVCYKNGWTFCDRLHIRIWGNKRAV